MLLAGDVGGTKTNLAIYSADHDLHAPLAEATLPSGDYVSLEALVSDFFVQLKTKGINPVDVNLASFGVAGPVINDQATITNLPWVMSEPQLSEALNIPAVQLLNDLAAIANAIPILEETDLHTINAGEPVQGGSIVVIAPGTGLGEAYLTWEGKRYRAHPSEGGHTDFAPSNALEVGLLSYLQKQFEHVSYERVCSGSGIPNIYAYLKDSGHAEEPSWLTEQLAGVKDPTPIIVNTAINQDRSCQICRDTLDTFISILAREAGNMALNILASGGVYLGGGIPPRILSALEDGPFMERFHRKGRFSKLLSRMPIQVILNPKAALMGAAYHGFNL